MIETDLQVFGSTAESRQKLTAQTGVCSVYLQSTGPGFNAPSATSPAAGITIGPALTFGYIAARHAATEARQ